MKDSHIRTYVYYVNVLFLAYVSGCPTGSAGTTPAPEYGTYMSLPGMAGLLYLLIPDGVPWTQLFHADNMCMTHFGGGVLASPESLEEWTRIRIVAGM